MEHIPILMYHALWPADSDPAALRSLFEADPQLRDPGARVYAVADRTFARHAQTIASEKYVSIDRWDRLRETRSSRAILLTFDDGHITNFTLALPILKRNGLRAAFFVTADWIGRDGFMTEDHLRRLRAEGMLIGAHGSSHRYLAALSSREALEEMVRSRRRLGRILGEPPEAMSLPGGSGNRAIRDLAHRAGYRYLFTSRIALAMAGGDCFDLPRIPITSRQPEDFLPELLRGDRRRLRRMAFGSALRMTARRALGVRLYDRLRGAILGDSR